MKTEISEIIAKVLDGTAGSDDYKFLKDWFNENDENAREFSDRESLWLALDIIANKEKFNYDKGYQNFLTLIKAGRNSLEIDSKRRIIAFWRIAASLILLISLSIFAFWLGKKSGNGQLSYYEMHTPKGSKSQVILPDGTKIWLNACSKLRYPNKFVNNTREVFLEGEGYFDVKKDTKRPFIVHTSDIDIRVLGTVFNVKSYPNEGTIETTLVSGKVIIESKNSKSKPLAQLLPNEKATYLRRSGKVMLNENELQKAEQIITYNEFKTEEVKNIILSEHINTSLYTSWKDNLLVFDNETFESIAYKLERRYGAVITFNNPAFKQYRFSGTFPEISIDRALNALQYASPFNYKIKGDSIFIGN